MLKTDARRKSVPSTKRQTSHNIARCNIEQMLPGVGFSRAYILEVVRILAVFQRLILPILLYYFQYTREHEVNREHLCPVSDMLRSSIPGMFAEPYQYTTFGGETLEVLRILAVRWGLILLILRVLAALRGSMLFVP